MMFKHKNKNANKTGIHTPKFRNPTPPPPPPTSGSNAQKIGSQVPPQYNPPPMPPIKPAKSKENTTINKTMYGLKLYIPFEDLDTYIHNRIDEMHKDHTFIPVKANINEVDLGIEITLVSANPIESDGVRYKLDLNALPKEIDND